MVISYCKCLKLLFFIANIGETKRFILFRAIDLGHYYISAPDLGFNTNENSSIFNVVSNGFSKWKTKKSIVP